MTAAATTPLAPVAVLDVPEPDGRRLAETVSGAGFAPVPVATIEELGRVLAERRALAAVVAFEAITRDAEATLRPLRAGPAPAHLVIVHADGSPRQRLAQRLWAAGLCDALVARSTPPGELAPLLRQACADAMMDGALGAPHGALGAPPPGGAEPLARQLGCLRALGAALTGQRTVEGLLRELHARLPALVDHPLLEALIVEGPSRRLFVCPQHPVDQEDIWRLAGDICDAVAPFTPRPPRRDELVYVDACGPHGAAPATPGVTRGVTMPMLVGGELVGCLGLLVPEPLAGDPALRGLLRLLSCQLATALRSAQAFEAASRDAEVDPLTGAHNLRYLARALETEWRRARRYRLQLSAAVVDIDRLRNLNLVHGHLVGDAVLREFARLCREHLRVCDHLIRHEGGAFLVLFPETGADEAALALERLRLVLLRTPIHRLAGGGEVHVTFSAGVATTVPDDAAKAEELVAAADAARLASKAAGRDRITVAAGSAAESTVADDRRTAPRVPTQLTVSYIALPAFSPHLCQLESANLSAGGIALTGHCEELRPRGYGLVYLEDEQRPMLTQVAWLRDQAETRRAAGLRFVRPAELALGSFTPAPPPQALVLTRGAHNRAVALRVLKAAAYATTFLDEAAQWPEALRLEDQALVVVDDSALRQRLGAELQRLRRAHGPAMRVIALNHGVNAARPPAVGTPGGPAAAGAPGGPGSAADAAADEALFGTLSKLALGDYFGVRKYLHWGAETLSWAVHTPADHDAALTGITQIADDVRCRSDLVERLLAAVAEVTAFALGQSYGGAPAHATPVTLQCGSDGHLLAVAVIDEHGLLQPDDMLGALGGALRVDIERPLPGEGHAHLGLLGLLAGSSQLAVSIDPGRGTEIVGIVDLRRPPTASPRA